MVLLWRGVLHMWDWFVDLEVGDFGDSASVVFDDVVVEVVG